MQNKPDCCLVQYTEPLFASLALQHLQGAQLYGQSLHLDFSKMREITIQPSNTDGRTKQFNQNEQRCAIYVKMSCVLLSLVHAEMIP